MIWIEVFQDSIFARTSTPVVAVFVGTLMDLDIFIPIVSGPGMAV